MKKHFILLLLLLFSSSILFAQLEKGNWFMAGYSNLGLDFGKSKTKYGSTTDENYKFVHFNLKPEVGYLVTNKLITGLFLDFDRYTTKYDNNDKDFDTKFIIGPFLRYYIKEFNGFWPYAEGRVGIGSEKYSSSYETDFDYKYSYFTTRLGVGTTYFVTEQFGLDLFLGYDFDKWTDNTDYPSGGRQMNSSDKNTDKWSSIEMNIGVVVTLSK